MEKHIVATYIDRRSITVSISYEWEIFTNKIAEIFLQILTLYVIYF